jgi:hypothetical protein
VGKSPTFPAKKQVESQGIEQFQLLPIAGESLEFMFSQIVTVQNKHFFKRKDKIT